MGARKIVSRIAVLICAAAGSPADLLLRALRSTAASLDGEDAFFLLGDGGGLPDEQDLEEACRPAGLRIFRTAERMGLAHGLNQLIERVLRERQWEYLARMDADDSSHPERLARQREFLEKNQSVDILGTGCREVDEKGRLLQIKVMPLTHDKILAALPRRNPLNHPTVIFRRRVFVKGLRYRTEVGRIEDYFLWVDAVAGGFRLANLEEPLLDFRRDQGFFKRRGGGVQARAEWAVRAHAMRALKKGTPGNYIWSLAAFGLRCLPSPMQELLYKRLR